MKTLFDETALNDAVKQPKWWHFDGEHGILYCEVEATDQLKYHEEIAKIIPSEQYEDAWIGRTSSVDYLLWKDNELVAGNEIVAEVEDWKFDCARNGISDDDWAFALYLAMDQCLHWIKSDDGREVKLVGAYKSGASFSDDIRLVVPLQNGHTLAISERNRWYFLYDEPINQYEFEKEEDRRLKSETKMLLAREKAELKALKAQEKADRRDRRERMRALQNALKIRKRKIKLNEQVKIIQ